MYAVSFASTRALADAFRTREAGDLAATAVVVSYDELVPLEAQAEMAASAAAAAAREGEGEEGASWREARRDILAAVRAVAVEDGACPEGEGAAEHYEGRYTNDIQGG